MRTTLARALGSAVAILALASAGCGADDRADADGGTIDHPRGADDVIVRVDVGGGYVPLVEHLGERLPRFALYGDGRAITHAGAEGALPALVERRLTEDGIQAILRAARDAGLRGPDRRYQLAELTDAHTTTFTVVADGARHVTAAYALEDNDEAPSRLVDFESSLHELDRWLPDGSVGPARRYDYEALVVFVVSDMEQMSDLGGADDGGGPREAEWPLASEVAALGEPLANMPEVRCGVVEGPELKRVRAAAERAAPNTLWRQGETVRLLAFVPLLPGEPRCPSE
jgi:hypothetical protein